jgi:hypothetical protein
MDSRDRVATPADFPLHDCSPYRGLHARRGSLGGVPRSRAIFCRPVPKPIRAIRNFPIAVQRVAPLQMERGRCGYLGGGGAGKGGDGGGGGGEGEGGGDGGRGGGDGGGGEEATLVGLRHTHTLSRQTVSLVRRWVLAPCLPEPRVAIRPLSVVGGSSAVAVQSPLACMFMRCRFKPHVCTVAATCLPEELHSTARRRLQNHGFANKGGPATCVIRLDSFLAVNGFSRCV